MVGTEEGGADFAIADLSVTSARNDAVQFRSGTSVCVFCMVAWQIDILIGQSATVIHTAGSDTILSHIYLLVR